MYAHGHTHTHKLTFIQCHFHNHFLTTHLQTCVAHKKWHSHTPAIWMRMFVWRGLHLDKCECVFVDQCVRVCVDQYVCVHVDQFVCVRCCCCCCLISCKIISQLNKSSNKDRDIHSHTNSYIKHANTHTNTHTPPDAALFTQTFSSTHTLICASA